MRTPFAFAAVLSLALIACPAMAGTAPDAGRENLVEVPAPPPAPPGQPIPAPTPRNPQDLRASLCVRPSLKPIMAAYSAMPEKALQLQMLIWVRYEDDGSIAEVRLEKASGDEALDAAVVSWGQRMRLCPGGGAGEGRLPFEFISE
jgi:hypothetical protein